MRRRRIVLLVGLVLLVFVGNVFAQVNEYEKKMEEKAEEYLKESEQMFEDYHKTIKREEIEEKGAQVNKFIAGLKKLSMPLQRILVKKALWDAKKVCEKTDNVEAALWATMPQFSIAHTLKEASTPELIKNFMDKSNDREFRYLCMESFYGPKDSVAVEPLIIAMMDSTDKLRGQACKILGLIKDKRAVEPMIELYWKGQMRKDVIWSLGVIGDKRAFNVLMDGLEDGNSKLKFLCIRALEGLKDRRAVPTLIKMIGSKEEIEVPSLGVRSLKPYIAITLGEIGDERAVPVLKEMLKNKDRYHRAKAEEALGKIKEAKENK